MTNHGMITVFIILFAVIPFGMGARIAPQIACDKMVNITEEKCKLWSEQAGQLSLVLFFTSIIVCLIIAVDFFSNRDKIEESKYHKQAIGNNHGKPLVKNE